VVEVLLPAENEEVSIPVYPVGPDGLDDALAKIGGLAPEWASSNQFKADAGSLLKVPGSNGQVQVIVLGIGNGNDREARMSAGALGSLRDGIYHLQDAGADVAQMTQAFALGAYRFSRYKDAAAGPRLKMSKGVDSDEVRRIARGVYLARDLINTPANDLGPAELAEAAHRLADRYSAMFRLVVGEQLLETNLPLIHAVGAASTREPRLIDIVWGPSDGPKVTLVGKGVCFDTGGLNLKPGSSMTLMKKDMGGAALVLGLASMIMDAELPVRLRVLIPAVENSVSGNAFRPGDVFSSRKGLTVEIGNTDAEGRLVLADALALADEDEPEMILDMATLTGAARVALGPDLPALFTDDDKLAAAIAESGEATADPTWRLPLWDPYDKMLHSDIADVNHISSGAFAGSITAALFLRRFVEKATTWAHVDVFAWSPKAKPARPLGGDGQAIRAIYAMLTDRYG